MANLSETIFGRPDKYRQLPTINPQQQQGLNQVYGQFSQMGQPGGNYQKSQDYYGSFLDRDPTAFKNFSSPYLQQFEQQIVPRLAERFAAYGGGLGGGTMGSSGFAQALGGAGSDLQSKLAQMYEGMRMQAANQVTGNYNDLSRTIFGTPTFENVYEKGDTGVIGNLASSLSSGLGETGAIALFTKLATMLGFL